MKCVISSIIEYAHNMNINLRQIINLLLICTLAIGQEPDPNEVFDELISSLSAVELLVEDTSDIHELIYDFQPQIEYALVWRVRAVNTYEALSKKSVLKASDINYLNYAANRYKDLREKLYNGIEHYAPLTNENVTFLINDSRPTILYQKSKFRQLFGGKNEEFLRINPNDDMGISVIKKLKLSMTFALLLYDNYLVAVAPYEESNKLRFIINEGGVDPEVEGYLRVVSESYTDPKKMQRLIKAIEFIEQIEAWEASHPGSNLLKDDDNIYLNKLIYGSPSYQEIRDSKKKSPESFFTLSRFNIFKNSLEDRIRNVSDNATNQISKIFGNTAGVMVSRRGKMELLSENEKVSIINEMQPLDILLEKAPFRLTDHLIPGYWSHVALWSGTELELKQLGIWDELPSLYNEAVAKYHYTGPDFQSAIRSGHMIIEALRPGVQINTFKHFLNIDDFGIIRFNDLTIDQKRQYLLNAFQQIGKNYDFNFDVESRNEIVCSELIYETFDDREWNTEMTMGRYTISPDNVAQKITQENMAPVLLYIDAKEVSEKMENSFPFE